MNAETYLRRALLAPVIVPMIAGLSFFHFEGANGIALKTIENQPSDSVVLFLLLSLIIGGIPYLWMLYAKREYFLHANGRDLEAAWAQLPLEMLPFYWKFWGVLTAVVIVTLWGAIFGLAFLVIGTFAIPVLGYPYVALTLGFLHLFRWVGLIEKE